MELNGQYFNGKHSKVATCILEITGDLRPLVTLHIFENDQRVSKNLEFNDIKVASRVGNTPREIYFGDDEMFTTELNDQVDELLKKFNQSKWPALLHYLESRIMMVMLASIVSITVTLGLFIYGIPSAAKFVAFNIPSLSSEKTGDSLAILDKTLFDVSEIPEARQQQIRELLEPYIQAHQDLNPRLHFRAASGANAFALPGGSIVFTDDFVELAQNDDELIGVFFHELGHLKNKHMTRRVLQDSMITLSIIFITGEFESADLIAAIPTLLLDLSHSRAFEIEADDYAIAQMLEYKIDPNHFGNILQRLTDTGDDSNDNLEEDDTDHSFDVPYFLSTHPATQERTANIKSWQDKAE